MRLIGYWLRNLKDHEFCLPQEVVGDLPSEVRSQLAAYLDTGALYEHYRGFSWCRFFCGAQLTELGSRELTDGEWVWPEGLAHYVRAHGILLPEEFIKHALSQAVPLTATLKGTPLDLDFWRIWCAARRSPTVLEHLSEARADADKLTEEWLDLCMADKVAEHGLSDIICLRCMERALKGILLCPKHACLDAGMVTVEFYSIKPEHVAEAVETPAALATSLSWNMRSRTPGRRA